MPAYTKHYDGKQSILYSKRLPGKKDAVRQIREPDLS